MRPFDFYSPPLGYGDSVVMLPGWIRLSKSLVGPWLRPGSVYPSPFWYRVRDLRLLRRVA